MVIGRVDNAAGHVPRRRGGEVGEGERVKWNAGECELLHCRLYGSSPVRDVSEDPKKLKWWLLVGGEYYTMVIVS
jgi:hypothetical protein